MILINNDYLYFNYYLGAILIYFIRIRWAMSDDGGGGDKSHYDCGLQTFPFAVWLSTLSLSDQSRQAKYLGLS